MVHSSGMHPISHSPLHPRVAIWIENAEGKLVFGKGRLIILEAIETHGSLSSAAHALGMSYRGLWARIRHSEERLGFPLIETHAGRGPDSGTTLTPAGRELLAKYRSLLGQVEEAVTEAFRTVFAEGSAPPSPREPH